MTQDLRKYITIIVESYSDGPPEEWIKTTINNSEVNVHWDKAKNAKNKNKHGYSLEQAIPVLNDPESLVYEDEIYNEYRLRSIGKNANKEIVSVAWTTIDTGEDLPCIRIIGMRPATPAEIERYKKEQMTETSKTQQLAEQEDIDDIPEIPADAHLVPMTMMWDKIVTKFKQRKSSIEHQK